MTDFNQQIIPIYSPITAKGGRRRSKSRIYSKNGRTKKYNRTNKSRTNKSRTRRRYI